MCAALAYQSMGADGEREKENSLFANEPDWIRASRQSMMAKVEPAIKFKARKKAKVDGELGDKLAALFGGSDDEPSAVVNEEEIQIPWRKIYFCSRTHSQLSQAMSELQKILERVEETKAIDVSSFSAVTLGSRANLCVNKNVTKLSSVSRINDKCMDLQRNAEGNCCPYYHPDKEPSMRLLEASMRRLHVADIEDMHKAGQEVGACSYYAAREVQRSAHLVTVPYNAILQKETREAFGIDLTGSIVIIDEAHNLIDAINSIHSVTLSLEAVEKSQRALIQYFDRYGKRLNPAHAQMILQLMQALGQLKAYGEFANKPHILRINEFLHYCKIDNLNVLPIGVYAREHHLSQKISGFYETEEKDTNLLNEAIRFLEMLTNSDGDGRVYVQQEPLRFKYISLNPEGFFTDVLEQAHSVILAGGTMSPCNDFIDQLFGITFDCQKIVQFSCDHLIARENCMAISIPCGPASIPFDFSFNNRGSPALLKELGQAIINLTNITPDGIVCFFPSYSYLGQVIDSWSESGILAAIEARKHVVIESSSVTSIDALIQEFREGVLHTTSKGAILFGVMGGRLSEGINFGDRLARLAVVVGMPFPNVHEAETAERVNHYLRRKTAIDPKLNPEQARQEFLENICMRSVNQTLGRVIRHKNDWAAMVLLDARYKQPRITRKFSGWIQECTASADTFGQAFSSLAKFYRFHKNI